MAADFVIYRIIGNALPPRHDAEHTRRNLKFVLEREPVLEGCDKRWLLNRMVNADLEAECIAMIEASGQGLHVIPFEPRSYRAAFYDASGMPAEFNPFGRDPEQAAPSYVPVKAYEWMMRHKSLSLIDLNAARNVAVELGRAEAAWVLPLDGWSFFTREAWRDMVAGIAASPDALYAMLPLSRLEDNGQLDDPACLPAATDEPQIAFRRDAPDRFDERRRYGNMNKAELLLRLGYPGPWDRWQAAPWETMPPLIVQAPDRFVACGRVYRLASGASGEVEESSGSRHLARYRGVSRLAHRIDRLLLRQHRDGHGGRDHGALLPLATWPAASSLADLERLAAAPLAAIGLPDGRTPDRAALWEGLRSASVLTASGVLAGRRDHLDRAGQLLHAWFVDPATAMHPHALPGRAAPGSWRHGGWIDRRDLWTLPALCRSLQAAGALPREDHDAIADWCGRMLDAQDDPGQPRFAHGARNSIGTWMHLLRLSLSVFAGRETEAAHLIMGSTLRLVAQCDGDGRQPFEDAQPRPRHHGLFNLTAWILLAGLCRSLGTDIWLYRGIEGQSICRMLCHAAEKARLAPAGERSYLQRWIAALLMLTPDNAADRALLPRRYIRPDLPWGDDPDRGLPPHWWFFLLWRELRDSPAERTGASLGDREGATA